MKATFPSQGAGRVGQQATNLVEVFRQRAEEQADQIAFTVLGEPHAAPQDYTYAELDRRARAVAARLQHTCTPGARALLMYETGIDYIAALAGCLYAGVVAVPVYPPDPLRATRTFPRLEAIIRDADASVLLGTAADLAWAGTMLGKIPRLHELVATDALDAAWADRWQLPELDRQSLAFLQYTSGSTSLPKGVVVRHGNVLANLAQMERSLDVPNALVCTWLPTYHDMGLIGGIFQCWYSARRNILLTPVAFFQQPLRWLQAISDYRATTTAAPDFAYEWCVRKFRAEECADLDLGCLQIAMSGAEPVRATTIEQFVETFGPYGMRRESFRPCYGLAEATLMVAAGKLASVATVEHFDGAKLAQNRAAPVNEAATNARTLVACGTSADGIRVQIVDPQTLECLADEHVGEIWVQGENVTAGYWEQSELSEHTFRARTADGAGPFLRTGDLGFFRQGELFIAGRLKDLIIVHGRNHHPNDLEQTVERCHEALKPHGGAAFSVEQEGRERVVIVHEVQRPKRFDLDEVAQTVRRAVLEAHDLVVDSVVLIRQGSLSKATSGKVQRHACRERYLAGGLNVLHATERGQPGKGSTSVEYVAPRNEIEAQLAASWADVFGVERVGVHDNFFDLGGHSLLAAQVANRLAPRYGIEITLAELFERPTIASLAELIAERMSASAELDDPAELALLAELERMSDDEVQAALAASRGECMPQLPSNDTDATHERSWWGSAEFGSLRDSRQSG
ncbi:MAG: AMP-binding protein [Pirellulales bacterium]|nr:AMP-binding protein [Pirellulales bacterium]